MYKKGFSAFTLAEVLITLGIIGVVAALTIPTLINNNQKVQYVTGLKKAYSEVNQALALMANDSGCPGDLSCFFDTNDVNTIGDKISSYFKVLKICKAGASQLGCFPDVVSWNFDGTNTASGVEYAGAYRFVTTDGMSVYIPLDINTSCDQVMSDPSVKMCVENMMIDINGLKKPNIAGRDIFTFLITTGKGPTLYPVGGKLYDNWITEQGCDYGYNGGVDIGGYRCAGRIMDEGWKMNY